MDVEYFPFDKQSCLMKFGSWTYNGNEVLPPSLIMILKLRPQMRMWLCEDWRVLVDLFFMTIKIKIKMCIQLKGRRKWNWLLVNIHIVAYIEIVL